MTWTKDNSNPTSWQKNLGISQTWDKEIATGTWIDTEETSYLLNSSNGKLLTDQYGNPILVLTGNEKNWNEQIITPTIWQT